VIVSNVNIGMTRVLKRGQETRKEVQGQIREADREQRDKENNMKRANTNDQDSTGKRPLFENDDFFKRNQ
jgi:hypothetical protein